MSADNKKDITIEKKDEKTEGIESRRRVLKKILMGSGAVAAAGMLPEKWIKPVINAVGPYKAHASYYYSSPSPSPSPSPGPNEQPNTMNQVIRQNTNTVKVKVKTRLGKFRSNTFSGSGKGSKGAGKIDTED